MKNIMWKTKFPSDALQRKELALERINGDEMAMTSQITVATEYSKKLDIDAEADFAKSITDRVVHESV